ncbi:hypothetical protein D910_05985, partial [Dendroctonus ponderosae]
MEAVARKPDK